MENSGSLLNQIKYIVTRVASKERFLSPSEMLFLSVFVLSAIIISGIKAQILHTTPLWDTNVNYTHADRFNAAGAALSQVVKRLGSFGQTGDANVANSLHFYEALANYNIITHQRNLSETTMSYWRSEILIVWNGPDDTLNGCLREIIQKGYTAIRAYLSLGEDYFLDRAKEYWETANHYTITDSDLQSERNSIKNISLPQTCGTESENYSLGGAVFQNGLRQSSVIDIYDTAYFFLFSSILASSETPANSSYVSAARASLHFVVKQPLGLVLYKFVDSAFGSMDCENITIISPGGTSVAGFVIEGLSILAVLEDDKDLHKLLLETIQQSFNITGWPSPTGILSNYHNWTIPGPSRMPELFPDMMAWDIDFVRGLAVAYRNATSLPSDVRDAIKAFLGVQYNAVRNQAHVGDNLYDGSWQDPLLRTYSPSFDVVNQSFAAQVLIDGIDIFDEPTPPPSSSSRVPVATLVGSIVGGVLFLAILIALAFFFYRRRQSAAADSHMNYFPSFFFSSSAIFVGPNIEVTPFEWDPEWYHDRPIQNTKKQPLSVDQNLNREPVPAPGEQPVVSTPPIDDNSDSPPEYRSQ
ncbi:hypothetical protein VNI00_007096 [Paramarasmius palmivorus]|uniref:Glycoside hydrolase family 76 protein n=1 Tax=Paramarasmius palmivorus TaxID=297713 RepID=A0AAW0D5I5_9AGAR